MKVLSEFRHASHGAARALVGAVALCGAIVGCSDNLSENDLLSRLQDAGLTVERLGENLLTSKQRQRIESEPETVMSVKISDGAGHSQKFALVGFDQDWKADHVGDEGVPGFALRNWYFVGVVTVPQIQSQVEAALQ